jgi:hypothetical protein
MSKDKFDLKRVSEKTWAAYGEFAAANIVLDSLDGDCTKELQAVIDQARVPAPPKTLCEIIDERISVAVEERDYFVRFNREVLTEALKRQEWRDSMVADVVRAAKIFALRRGTSGHDRALEELVQSALAVPDLDKKSGK